MGDPADIAAGDFDGDGDVDLAVLLRSPGKVGLLLNHGDATFTYASGPGFPTSFSASRLVAGDFDGDGNLDLAATMGAFSFGVYVMLGHGDGTFWPAASACPTQQNYSKVLVGDFDHDGFPDLVGVGDGRILDVMISRGDGTFDLHPFSILRNEGHLDALGDFDGDGYLDLALTDSTSVRVDTYLGHSGGTFSWLAYSALPVPGPYADLTVTDLDGDGNLDLVVGWPDSLQIFPGLGNGTFGPPTARTAQGPGSPNPGLAWIAAADLDGDGLPDLAATDFGENALLTFLGDGSGGLKAPSASTLPAADYPVRVLLVDLDGDGLADAVTVNSGFAWAVTVFRR